jgi:Skp family chaperone for outer membrane proteins
MKFNAFATCLAVAVLYACSARAAEPLPLGLVNVDRILKEYKPLNEQIDPLKAEAKDLDGKVQVRQAEMETVANQARQTQPGSPEFQRLQIQLVKLQTDLQQFVAKGRHDLQQKEATIYLTFFRQLDAEVSKYAKANGLKLVLRQYETSFEEGQSLPDVAKSLNRTILYEEGLDITDAILKALRAQISGGER